MFQEVGKESLLGLQLSLAKWCPGLSYDFSWELYKKSFIGVSIKLIVIRFPAPHIEAEHKPIVFASHVAWMQTPTCPDTATNAASSFYAPRMVSLGAATPCRCYYSPLQLLLKSVKMFFLKAYLIFVSILNHFYLNVLYTA